MSRVRPQNIRLKIGSQRTGNLLSTLKILTSKRYQALLLHDFWMLESTLQTCLKIQISTDWLERFLMLDIKVLPQERTLIGELPRLLLLPLWSKTVIMFVFQDRMLKEEPSPIDMLTFSTKIKMVNTVQSTTLCLKVLQEDSLLQILISQNLRSSGMSLDTLKQIQILWLFGKHNLVISQMVLKSLSINSLSQERPNGTLRMV
jgi:hypothetical protein